MTCSCDARLRALELAVEALSRRLPPAEPPASVTVFGVPVVLAPGVTHEAVRGAAADLPPGLSAGPAVDRLEELGLVRRVKR